MNKVWLKYIIGIALITNVITLGFLFFRKPKLPMPPEEVLVQTLKLDDAQRQQFEVLKMHDRALRDSFLRKMADARGALYRNFRTATPSEIDSSTAVAAAIFQDMEKSNYQHFADIRALCRPEQQAQFDSLLLDIVQLLNRKRGRRPPR